MSTELEYDFDKDLPGALRAGLGPLHAAAAAAGLDEDAVEVVTGAAWDAFTGFSGHGVPEYNSVVTLAIGSNGWAWAEAVLVDPEPREAWFRRVRARARRFGHRHFSRLPEAEREAAADDAMVRLSGRMVDGWMGDHRVPMWTVWPIVQQNARWLLLTAARGFDRERTAGDRGSVVMSLDAYFEACGEHGVASVDYGAGTVDDCGVEAAVWADARARLDSRAAMLALGARAGSARDRLVLTVDAAKWVLSAGSQGCVTQYGLFDRSSDEEIREEFAQDSLLVCFQGLRAAAPETWGAYPEDKVPTREVIARVAADAAARGDVHAGWFAKLEARRVDVAKSDRVLHGVRALVESVIEEAAHDAVS